jgi:hypothetical protein
MQDAECFEGKICSRIFLRLASSLSSMTEEIPIDLRTRINKQVLEYIADKSAHSDLSDAMMTALKPLGDVQLFCPDWAQYRYVVASTKGIIFAFAVGMRALAFRLDETMKARALATGASAHTQCGDDWVLFEVFRSDWPKVDLEFWGRNAYVAAREDS